MPSYRTIFISDVHLGFKGSQAGKLLKFLETHTADEYYLVGDILDLCGLGSTWHFPESHNKVIEKILEISKVAKVHFVLGNHENIIRCVVPIRFGEIKITDNCDYISKNGERFLVIHGDQFDNLIRKTEWFARIGDETYNFLMVVNRFIHTVRRKFKMKFWSLSHYLKCKNRFALEFVDSFESVIADFASKNNYNGVICGHIHMPKVREITIDNKTIMYYNCGDWVEVCSALVEHHDGSFEIIE